ncbi:Protein ImpG/VasA [hydrothermal vent metagenome]|uniref:Protein ImpG/VasA n=1 Tax=hydrothermal vent metagenome TaxID=652676 RepID=A0A3B1DAB6_9ZZZZ
MNPKLLDYYNRELQFLREMGGEFAAEYPKIASRLGLDSFECADPYVERLLEGFSFLAARVQLKLDAEFPKFTQHLLELVCPHYLAPTPSMTVVQLNPDLNEGALAEGYVVPRETALRAQIGKNQQTACEYRTAQDVTLWPIKLTQALYVTDVGSLPITGGAHSKSVKAGVVLRFKTTGGLSFDKLPLETLSLFLRGRDETSMHLYEQLMGNAVGLALRPAHTSSPAQHIYDASHIRRVGFEDDEALLPYGARSFQGYRLLQEYFTFPERYMFVAFAEIGEAVRRCASKEMEVIVLLNRSQPRLEKEVVASRFSLFCTPAINLFSKRADRILLSDRENRYHVVPDRTRPLDFEVYGVTNVTGYGTSTEYKQAFLPFYAFNDLSHEQRDGAYYAIHREPTVLSSKQKKEGRRSTYVANEIFISLVDSREVPFHPDLRQLSLNLLCTNRDLPLHMPTGKGEGDFTLESGAPVASVTCLAGPTKPRPSQARGETAWRLISHLSLNYLSLMDNEKTKEASALRELLMLYGDMGEAAVMKQIEGIKSVVSQAITRRIPLPGPVSYGRGLEITITFNDAGFEGTGFFLLGAVLDQFFAKYVSINSFTETVIKTVDRGEVVRWPIRAGRRHIV